jgi:crossover junction endodeoxyribonuclease RuvC
MPASEEIVLGIDPGLGTTGWGVVRSGGGRFTYVNSGRIMTRPAEPVSLRLEKLFRELQQVVQDHQVTQCAVESGFVGKSPLSALKLGQARAAAVLAAVARRIPVHDVAPREVKMAITGRGSAAKSQVSFMVSRLLSLQFDSGEEDISDALAAALCVAMRRASVRAGAAAR